MPTVEFETNPSGTGECFLWKLADLNSFTSFRGINTDTPPKEGHLEGHRGAPLERGACHVGQYGRED